MSCCPKPLALLLAGVATATLAATTAVAAPVENRASDAPSDKAPRAMDASPSSTRYIDVKFAEKHQVRADGSSVQATGESPDAVAGVQSLLADQGITDVAPLFAESADTLRDLRVGTRSAAHQAPDLSSWVRITVADVASVPAVLAALRNQESVEMAYQVPEAAEPPASSGTLLAGSEPSIQANFTNRQTYLRSASSGGVDAEYAWTVPGGTGENVTITDIEYGWTTRHEDLSKLRGAVITRGTPRESWHDHGTAVAGQLWADRNSFGVTGISYGAKAQLSHAITTRGTNIGAAITTAVANSDAGDVILIEQQVKGCGGGYAPVEVIPSVYDAIKTATNRGIHVVEAAGNGGQNLDARCYGGSSFPGGRGDSGAIIVGAGASSICGRTPHSPLSFSTYGSRVNVQGWGECVTTAGYGDLQGGGPTREYTRQFSGTSSASPMVAGSVAAISSVAERNGKSVSPSAMRDLLVRTGTPQTRGRKVGPLPDLRAALKSLGTNPSPSPTATATATASPSPTATATTSPTATPTSTQPVGTCEGYSYEKSTTLDAGDTAVHPNGKYYKAPATTHYGCVIGQPGMRFRIQLQKWNGRSWYTIGGKTGEGKQTYSVRAYGGYFRVLIDAANPNSTAQYSVGVSRR